MKRFGKLRGRRSRSKRGLTRKVLWEGLWVLFGVKRDHWKADALTWHCRTLWRFQGLWEAQDGRRGTRGTSQETKWGVMMGVARMATTEVGERIKHCFLGAGTRKVPFPTLGKSGKSHGKTAPQTSILTALTCCWSPRGLFKREEGRRRRRKQGLFIEHEASGR